MRKAGLILREYIALSPLAAREKDFHAKIHQRTMDYIAYAMSEYFMLGFKKSFIILAFSQRLWRGDV